MKNLIIITAMFLLPLAIVGQSETTNLKKNSLTGSLYLSSDSGAAIDYRRTFKGNQQIVVGLKDADFKKTELILGYRTYMRTEKRVSFGVGLDVLLRKRNVIGDGVVARTFEFIPRPEYRSLRTVGGMYIDINDKLEFMTELHLKTFMASMFSQRATTTLNFGLKYDF